MFSTNLKIERMKASSQILAVLLVGVIGLSQAVAQSREDCLACHSDKSMSMEKKGKQVSLFVEATDLENSTHKKLV